MQEVPEMHMKVCAYCFFIGHQALHHRMLSARNLLAFFVCLSSFSGTMFGGSMTSAAAPSSGYSFDDEPPLLEGTTTN